MKILVKNGTLITAEKEQQADIFIDGEKITLVAPSIDQPADKIIDAANKLVIPGGIDVHTHMSLPVGTTRSSDTFETGTRAAAFGGTTTIVDFAQQEKGRSFNEALEGRLTEAKPSVIDYGFHFTITDLPEDHLSEMDTMIERGVTSFKLFTVYPNRLMADDDTITRAFKQSTKNGGLICIHAEDQAMIAALEQKAAADRNTEPKYHAVTRPAEAEGRAVKRIIGMARQSNAPVYFVHISCDDSLVQITKARSQGQTVYGETCPQYLFITVDELDRPEFEAAKYIFTPPPRKDWNQEILWEGLKSDSLQVFSTDHCPFNFHGQKDLGKNDFTKIPSGVPGVEHRLELLYAIGAMEGRISRQRWVELCSTNPAKLFGLWPEKGSLAVGSDADVVIWNPKQKHVISATHHHMNVDYSLYEGMRVTGQAETVIARGDVLIENREWKGNGHRGKFLHRKKPELI